MPWYFDIAKDSFCETLRLRQLIHERQQPSGYKHGSALEPGTAEFIAALAGGSNSKRILHVGCGLSTLALAAASKFTGGCVASIDTDTKRQQVVSQYIEDFNFTDYVKFYSKDPISFLPKFGNIDFALFTGEPKAYIHLFDLLKLKEGAIVVAYNALNEVTNEYIKHVRQQPGVDSSTLPLGQGIEVTKIISWDKFKAERKLYVPRDHTSDNNENTAHISGQFMYAQNVFPSRGSLPSYNTKDNELAIDSQKPDERTTEEPTCIMCVGEAEATPLLLTAEPTYDGGPPEISQEEMDGGPPEISQEEMEHSTESSDAMSCHNDFIDLELKTGLLYGKTSGHFKEETLTDKPQLVLEDAGPESSRSIESDRKTVHNTIDHSDDSFCEYIDDAMEIQPQEGIDMASCVHGWAVDHDCRVAGNGFNVNPGGTSLSVAGKQGIEDDVLVQLKNRDSQTEIVVEARDQQMLLADIMMVFTDMNLSVHDAKISTENNHVKDVFHVVDQKTNFPVEMAQWETIKNRIIESITKRRLLLN